MGELVDTVHYKTNQSSLNSMRVQFFRGELRNDSMNEVEDLVQPTTTNDETINTLLEISQQNTPVI